MQVINEVSLSLFLCVLIINAGFYNQDSIVDKQSVVQQLTADYPDN